MPETSVPSAPQHKNGTFSDSDMTFVYNNFSVKPNESFSSAESKLGKASSVSSAPSCIGTGEDKIYNYNGFTVETYPDPAGEKILNITLTSPSVKTPAGACLGMTADDIKRIYGSAPEADEYFISYKASGNMHLDFLLDGGKVIEIAFFVDVA